MKRREFVAGTTAFIATLAGGRAKATTPCPMPTVRVDTENPVATTCEPPPSWVPSPGQWAEVGLNTVVDVAGPAPATGAAIGTGNGFLNIWAGGAYAPGYGGRFGSVIYGPNGGHASYDGNDVYAYDIESRLCSLVKATYNPTDRGYNNSLGEWPDGSPMPPHDYDGHTVLPIGAKGSLVVPQTYANLTFNPGDRVSVSHLLDLDTKVWSRGADFVKPVHPAAAYDPSRQCMWYYGEPVGPLSSYDGTTFRQYDSNHYAIAADTVATIDTQRDQFVHLRHDGALFVTDLKNPNAQPPPITVGVPMGQGAAFEYVEERDRIIAWNGGRTVYALDPNNYAAGWIAEGSSSSQVPPDPVNNSYSKYIWCRAVRCLIGISGATARAYAYRPLAT